MSKTIDQLIEEQTREYHNNCAIHLDDSEAIAFKVGANFVKAEMQKENEKLKSLLQKAVDGLKFYQGIIDLDEEFTTTIATKTLADIKKEMGEL